MLRVFDHAGLGGRSRYRAPHVAFRDFDHVGVRKYQAFAAQQDLFSYNDYNFADNGQQIGQTSGFALESVFTCGAEQYLECWVVIGAFSNADGTNFQSYAFNEVQAQLNASLTINYGVFE